MEEKEKSKFDRLAEKIEAGETNEQQLLENIKRKWHNFDVLFNHYSGVILVGIVVVGGVLICIVKLFRMIAHAIFGG